ncbi:hypothetical protein HCN52_07155, partial [Streptomyces bohaiensis]|nr:hypothetical protein [Streptomyces bohaiensis]
MVHGSGGHGDGRRGHLTIRQGHHGAVLFRHRRPEVRGARRRGGGGLGTIALNYGYRRSETDFMLVIILALIVIVTVAQLI